MNIVNFLYAVKINKFGEVKKFLIVKHFRKSLLVIYDKTGLGGLQFILSLIAKWSLISFLMTRWSHTSFWLFVKSKSIMVLELLKHRVYSMTSWVLLPIQ